MPIDKVPMTLAGFERLSEEMKRLKPHVPVMIFSGAAQVPEDIEKADVFVTKLETIPVMLEEISRLLHLHQS